jgi:hypothetical protein
MGLSRRECLTALGWGAAWPAMALVRPGARIAATWREGESHRLGVLEASAGALRVSRSLELPSRAHGLLQQADGRLLAVARRPGDWLLRWDPATGATEWHWAEDGPTFNGHLRASLDGRRLFTTETDPVSGEGLLGVRHAGTLRLLHRWPTHGLDPHDLRPDTDGSLLVANGGIATAVESGRRKLRLDRMDSSLVRLDGGDGMLRARWRLPDPRLSLRHLAWSSGAGPRVLGIALQAEHDEADARARAPVLALHDGRALRIAQAPHALAGYGGDVASAGGLFAVGCPRSHGVALFDLQGRWQGFEPSAFACAIAADSGSGTFWAGGKGQALRLAGGAVTALTSGLELDNHWLALPK